MAERTKTASRRMNLPTDLEWALKTCARCGFCKAVCCTQPHGGGFEAFSPRAKIHYLKLLSEGRAELTAGWVDRLFRCTTCERCQEACQCSIPLVHLWEEARAIAVDCGLGPMPAHKQLRTFVEESGNPYNEPQKERSRWMLPHHAPSMRAETLVFAGCTAAYRMPKMLQTGVTILQRQHRPYVYSYERELCCGSPFLRTGQNRTSEALIAGNIDLFHSLGIKRIVTPCGGCSKTLKKDYPEWAKELGKEWNFQVMHFSELYLEFIEEKTLIPRDRIEKVVTYHDPCHVGRSQRLFDAPRAILRAIPGIRLVEMEHTREESRCCGAGGGVRSCYPEMAEAIARERVQEAIETGAEILTTMCPFCQTSFGAALKQVGALIRLSGVEELLLESLGG